MRYTPDKMIVVVAGDYDRDGIHRLVGDTLGRLERGRDTVPTEDAPDFTPSLTLTKKRFEQTSMAFAVPGLHAGDPRRYAMMVLNFIVGGGSSSRLFQRLREELGLTYSIYSSHTAALDAGIFTVLASFSSDSQDTVLKEITEILEQISHGVTDEEFERARAQVKASATMGLETVSAKATFLGHSELFEGREITCDEMLENLNRLTREDVDRLAAEILGGNKRALSVAGKVKKRAFYAPFVGI